MDIKLATENLRIERMGVFKQLEAQLDATAGRERSEEEKTVIARMDARIDEIDAAAAHVAAQVLTQGTGRGLHAIA